MPISDQPKSDYASLLKDPRWQKKRLKIMERDNYTCQVCGDTTSELHVHHRYYKNSEGPWDYPDRALVTLCKTCHQMYGHGALSGQDHLIAEILSSGAFYAEMNMLAEAFSHAKNLDMHDFKCIAGAIYLYVTEKDGEKRSSIRQVVREELKCLWVTDGPLA